MDGVAAAGKQEYPLPTYVNCALMNPGDVGPGDYNSGGPAVHVLDIWKAAAPYIDVLSPDIYFPDFLKRPPPTLVRIIPCSFPKPDCFLTTMRMSSPHSPNSTGLGTRRMDWITISTTTEFQINSIPSATTIAYSNR